MSNYKFNKNPTIKLVNIAAQKWGETRNLFWLSYGKKAAHLPKSLVWEDFDGTFVMPEWLAKKKGFI